MNTPNISFSNRGSFDELVARTKFLLKLSRRGDIEPSDAFRLQIAGLYFARAIADQMLVQAKKIGGKNLETQIDGTLAASVKYYKLVDTMRVHDFHRRAFLPPIPGVRTVTMSGPAVLTARQGGYASLSGIGAGKRINKTRNSTVTFVRPVEQENDAFFDDASRQWVRIEVIVQEYLDSIEPLLDVYVPRMAPDIRSFFSGNGAE